MEKVGEGKPSFGVRYALAAIKNVGRQAMDDVVAGRQLRSNFADLADFATRLGQSAANKRSSVSCSGRCV